MGLLLRLAIMPFTWSDDGALVNSFASLLPEQGVVLVHTYMREHFAPMLDAQQWSYYPLGTYFTFGLWQLLTRPLAPGFLEWMGGVREIYGQGGGYLPHYVWGAGDVPIFRALLVAKLPYLFADFGIALLLPRLVPDPRNALFAHRLWMLNPVTLYATYAYGQFEILEALLMTAGLLLAQRGHPRWTVLLLGAAATYKHIPLLLVPPTAFLLGRDWRQRLLLVLIGSAPYLGARLVSLLFAPGVEGAMGNPYLGLSYAEFPSSRLALLLRLALPITYLLLLLLLVRRGNSLRQDSRALGRSWLIILLFLLVGLRPIGAYWYVLLTPLWALECGSRRGLCNVIALHVLSLVPWTFSPGFNWGAILAPFHPLLFPALPTPESLVLTLIPWGYIAKASWYVYVLVTLALVGWLFLSLFRPHSPWHFPTLPLNGKAYRIGVVAGVGTLVLIAIAAAPSAPQSVEYHVRGMWQYRLPPDSTLRLTPGQSVGQSFVSALPNLHRIDLYVRPAQTTAPPALVLRLRGNGPAGNVVAESHLPTSAVVAGVARFDFPPQPESGSSRYYFEVTSGPSGSPVEIGWTADPYAHLPTMGQRFEHGQPAAGDLAFDSFHAGEPLGKALAQVAGRLTADPPFSLLYLGALAACASAWLGLKRAP